MKAKKLLAMFMVVLSMFVMLSSSVTAAVPEEDLSKTYYLNFDLPYPYPELDLNPGTWQKPITYVTFSSDSRKIVTISGEWAPEAAIIHYAIYNGEFRSIAKGDLIQTGKISIKDFEQFRVMEAGTYTLVIIGIDYNEKLSAITRVAGHLKIVVPELYSW